jgi:peptidoglycan hydrolase-like protein with peptidoglycan-binding domain
MVLRKAIHLSLALLVTAGSGVFAAGLAATQSQNPQNSSKAKAAAGSKTGAKGSHRPSKKASSRRKEKGQTAPSPDRVSQIQEALAKDGSFGGTPNGKWDDSTVEAMKKFQGAHRLNPSGRLDALTLQKLGLGSQTAGIAEPVAPPNSSSRLTGAAVQSSRQ